MLTVQQKLEHLRTLGIDGNHYMQLSVQLI